MLLSLTACAAPSTAPDPVIPPTIAVARVQIKGKLLQSSQPRSVSPPPRKSAAWNQPRARTHILPHRKLHPAGAPPCLHPPQTPQRHQAEALATSQAGQIIRMSNPTNRVPETAHAEQHKDRRRQKEPQPRQSTAIGLTHSATAAGGGGERSPPRRGYGMFPCRAGAKGRPSSRGLGEDAGRSPDRSPRRGAYFDGELTLSTSGASPGGAEFQRKDAQRALRSIQCSTAVS